MKKKLVSLLAMILLCVGLTGCQSTVRDWGGEMTIELEPNTKLENITWKEDSIWYCTRPMREDEEAETHKYQQSTTWGVFEGTVVIIESKE